VERGLATVRFAQAFRRFQLLCNCAFPFSRLARRPSHHGSIRSQQLALMLPLLSAASEHVSPACRNPLTFSAETFGEEALIAAKRRSVEPTSGECLKSSLASGLETERGMPSLAEGTIDRPGPRPRHQHDAPDDLSVCGYLVVVGVACRLQQ
jgi:hypothetical protein